MWQLLLFLIFLIFSYAYYYYLYKPKRFMQLYAKRFLSNGYKPYTLPYSPFGLPATQIFIKDTIQYGDCLMFHKRELQGYDVLISNIGRQPFLRLLNPDLIQEMCVQQREWCYEKDRMAMSFAERIIGKGLISSEGEFWKRKRKLMNSIFNFDFISSMTDTIKKKTVLAMQKAELNSQEEGKQKIFQFKVFQFTMSIFSNVIFEGFLGGDQLKNQKLHGEDVTKFFIKVVDDVLFQFTDPLPWIFGIRFLDAGIRQKDRELNSRIALFNAWAIDFIKKRIGQETERMNLEGVSYIPRDIISAIVWENKKSNSVHYNEKEILDEFKTFFLAGTDSTAHFLQAIIFFVFKQPHVQAQLRKQIQNIRDDFLYDDIKGIKYLDAIEKQVIRMVGPDNAIAPRVVVKDHYLRGVEINAGIGLHEASITNHYSTKYYKDPQQFRPERWLNGECDCLHPFAHVGFHGGPRGCLGKSLALLQAKTALVCIVKRYRRVQVLTDEINLQLRLLMGAKEYEIRVEKK